MEHNQLIEGFSKKSREEKIRILQNFTGAESHMHPVFDGFRHGDEAVQNTLEKFSENTISNFHLPFGIAPNFLIDGAMYHIPMVVEESSVVAAAAKSAKFWATRGGFRTVELQTVKKGQVHFLWNAPENKITQMFEAFYPGLLQELKPITERMEKRGGGVKQVHLLNKTHLLPHYFQLDFDFNTVDSMGANFINSVLEKAAALWEDYVRSQGLEPPEIIMAILSNYTPNSNIRMQLRSPLEGLNDIEPGLDGATFAHKFQQAVNIARSDPYRAVTHNKGIMNGADAVILATGNDFRAAEAGAHAFAASNGKYRALTICEVTHGEFIYELNMPLSIGTVGGLTKLHPLAAKSLEILKNPDARSLMKIVAAAGLANNFGALRSLVTTGIQKGHMKLHLNNILNALEADTKESEAIKNHFAGKTVSYAEVKKYLNELRNK